MITIQDRNQFLQKLELIKEQLFTNKKIDDVVDGILTPEEKEEFYKNYKGLAAGRQGYKSYSDYINALILQLQKLPVIELALSQHPTVAMLIKISEWLNKNLKIQTLITYKVDPSIIAGTKIGYNGLYKDYSIGNQLNK